MPLTNYLEVQLLPNVSTSWQTVSLDNTYTNPIPICTYVLPSFTQVGGVWVDPPAVTRIQNITSSSFQLKIQGWENSAATTSAVHCVIAEAGAHTLPDGHQFEAHSVLSDQTNGQYATDGTGLPTGGWNQTLLEDVSSSIVHTYTDPVVIGQVMSYNDSRASVFYNTDCDTRQGEPFQTGMADGICVGKHIGMIPDTRNPETVGYIVTETGSGTVNGISYASALGADTVAGAPSSYTYGVSGDFDIGVLTQAGEDGGNGSWAVLYGADPLPNNTLTLAVDEEVFAGDVSRRHTREPVAYWIFDLPTITLQKNVINNDGGTATSADFTLSFDNGSGVSGSGVMGDAAITNTFIPIGTYTLNETNLPGYDASSWSCNAGSLLENELTISAPDDIICRITNDDTRPARLTLVKRVINNENGTASDIDFTLSFDNGAGTSGSGVEGDTSITSVVIPTGTYTLSEVQLPGYTLDSIRCDGDDTDGSDGLTILESENITCTFTNNDIGVDLEITKSVSDPSPNIGDTITFTLDIQNNGPNPATNISIDDLVTQGFTYQTGSILGGDSNNESTPSTGTGLNWIINNLNSGGSASLTFQVVVLAP